MTGIFRHVVSGAATRHGNMAVMQDEEAMGWTYLERYDQHWLKIDGREVALISKRVPGGRLG